MSPNPKKDDTVSFKVQTSDGAIEVRTAKVLAVKDGGGPQFKGRVVDLEVSGPGNHPSGRFPMNVAPGDGLNEWAWPSERRS